MPGAWTKRLATNEVVQNHDFHSQEMYNNGFPVRSDIDQHLNQHTSINGQARPAKMKLSTAIITLAGLVSLNIQGSVATCYGSGDFWPNTDEALRWVSDACRNKNGMFTGRFEPGQTKRMCPVSAYNPYIGCGFEIQNLNTREGFELDDNDCYNRLKNEILGCLRGGTSTVSGWRFKADPGNC